MSKCHPAVLPTCTLRTNVKIALCNFVSIYSFEMYKWSDGNLNRERPNAISAEFLAEHSAETGLAILCRFGYLAKKVTLQISAFRPNVQPKIWLNFGGIFGRNTEKLPKHWISAFRPNFDISAEFRFRPKFGGKMPLNIRFRFWQNEAVSVVL